MPRILPLLALVAIASPVQASTPFFIHSYNNAAVGSGTNSTMVREGLPFFVVNAVPMPTGTVPGSAGGDFQSGGANWTEWEAPFDSSLLRFGMNRFDFAVYNAGGDDSRTNLHHTV